MEEQHIFEIDYFRIALNVANLINDVTDSRASVDKILELTKQILNINPKSSVQ